MNIPEYSGENWPTVQYGVGCEGPIFYRVCPICSRYVKADESSQMPEYTKGNATCKKHGRVKMPFAGWGEEIADWAYKEATHV